MKKLLLFVLIGTTICICLAGCAKHSDSDHPKGEHSHSEHSGSEHPQ